MNIVDVVVLHTYLTLLLFVRSGSEKSEIEIIIHANLNERIDFNAMPSILLTPYGLDRSKR